jgi:hypothetical protein
MTASLLTTTEPTVAEIPTVATEPVVKVRRRTIDKLLIAVGGVAAIVLAIAGGLLLWGHNFASDYVHDELSSQNIFFPGADELSGEGRTDLVQYADQQVTSGNQAEAYASFINGHLEGIADGQTYADLGGVQSAARDTLATAQESGTAAEVTDAQAALDTVSGQRDSLFKGETLRGLLLSSYAWSTIGQIAGIAAVVAFVAAGVMAILVVAGLVHMRKGHNL